MSDSESQFLGLSSTNDSVSRRRSAPSIRLAGLAGSAAAGSVAAPLVVAFTASSFCLSSLASSSAAFSLAIRSSDDDGDDDGDDGDGAVSSLPLLPFSARRRVEIRWGILWGCN